MPCYHPLKAFKSPRAVAFHPIPDSYSIQLPCGRCIGCRLERSRQWAVRLMHENRFHDESSFITLTYDEDHLPPGGSLDVKHFQDFMKRLRKELEPRKIRFFHAGEYGERRGRPHYHAIIFGESFERGAYDVEETELGDEVWQNEMLDKLWPFGINKVGAVTFESCAYVARYITKKISGPSAQEHYERVNLATGEVLSLKPEYATMSRRPGIGQAHFEKYSKSIYPRDEVAMRGRLMKPPRYYDRCLQKADPVAYQELKERRECALASAPKHDRTEQRLLDREIVKFAQTGTLKRRYEIG